MRTVPSEAQLHTVWFASEWQGLHKLHTSYCIAVWADWAMVVPRLSVQVLEDFSSIHDGEPGQYFCFARGRQRRKEKLVTQRLLLW